MPSSSSPVNHQLRCSLFQSFLSSSSMLYFTMTIIIGTWSSLCRGTSAAWIPRPSMTTKGRTTLASSSTTTTLLNNQQRIFSPKQAIRSIVNHNDDKRIIRHTPTQSLLVRSASTSSSSSTSPTSSSDQQQKMPHDDDKMPFYALGVNLAMQVGRQGNFKTLLDEEELDMVLEGFCENLKGTALVDAGSVLATYGTTLNGILKERSNRIVDRVKKDGEEYIQNFLDCNDDAIKTDSGLVYCPMTEGEGKQPTLDNTVEVHYHGTLTDGTVFDSSVDRGQTISFPLSAVIKGWQEGLQRMKEGGKATLVIPSDLAYGDSGSGDTIPPGATLVFEVELFAVTS